MAIRIAVIALLLCFLAPSAWAKEKVYILHKPKPPKEEVRSTYANEDLNFTFDLREGFTFTEKEAEDGSFNLVIELKDYPLSAALTVETLDEELTSTAYWRLMQDRDPAIEEDLVYERPVEVAGVNGLQVRIEGSGQNSHYLILSKIFTSGTNGYILSCFTNSHFFEKVPDFLDEISDGFKFIDTQNDEDKSADNAAEDGEKTSTKDGNP